MKGFGRGNRDDRGDRRRTTPKRGSGARPGKSTPTVVPRRAPDAELGRAMRGLVGPARGGSRARGASAGGRAGAGRARIGGVGLSRVGFGRLIRPARAAGLLGMLACGFALTFVTGPTAFGLSRTDLPKLAWTSEQTLSDALALTKGGNLFRLDTAPLVAALRSLPGVADASIDVQLAGAVVAVHVVERAPVLAWQVGTTRYIADAQGVVFATLPTAAKLPAGIAIIEDDRSVPDPPLAIGAHLDVVDLDVATRLGSLVPGDVGSNASRLRVAITDPDGWVLIAQGGWTADFGFYSPATRPTDMIPGQVRLLRSLLAGREASVARIILASETHGTYVPRATPKPTPR